MPTSYADAIRQGKQQKSLYKFFLSFMVLADYDVSVRAGSEVYDFPYRKIRISEKFWRADGCFRTGQCCSKVNMDLFLSSEEFSKLQVLYPTGLQPWQAMQLQVKIEGENLKGNVQSTVWTSIGGNKCAYLNRHMGPDGYLNPETGKKWEISGCEIHLLNPIHCALPHLYLDIRNARKAVEEQYVNITKRQFGRNWAFGCPVEFTRYNEFARRRDLELFNRCKDLLIEFTGTAKRVEDIIARIEERDLLVADDMLPVL
jgi:hypothetical protein